MLGPVRTADQLVQRVSVRSTYFGIGPMTLIARPLADQRGVRLRTGDWTHCDAAFPFGARWPSVVHHRLMAGMQRL